MNINKLHADEMHIDVPLVRKLIKDQYPKWANLQLELIKSGGTQNAIYRLGNDMAIRLPRIPGAANKIAREYAFLPKLAPHLPLSIPSPLVKGKPTEYYPWDWYIYRWLNGESAVDTISDLHEVATDLGHFVTALHKIDATNGSLCRRGKPLIIRDEETRLAIKALHGVLDTDVATKAWNEALAIPQWNGKPVWIHGDLHADNMLTLHGRINAIVDFGSSGVGDPAVDMMVAWTVLTPETRDAFRKIVQVDDATWGRGCGWALTFGLVAFPYYEHTNPILAKIARRAINEAVEDFR